jgi:outer membrane protein
MLSKSILLASAVALTLPVAATRAENLIEVYQAAVQSDPLIREAEARRAAALEVKPQARGLLFPQINLGGQVYTADTDTQGFQTQFITRTDDQGNVVGGEWFSVPFTNKTNTDWYWDYSAQLTQTLFRWDQWQRLKQADVQVALAEANYRAAQQDLALRVSQRYFDVLAAEDTLSAAEATLEAVNRQQEQAEKRFEVGLIAITDVQEARAARDEATAAVISAKRVLANTQEALRELTGEAYAELMKPSDNMPLDQPEPLDEEAWVAQAADQNLQIIAARLGVDIAKRNVKIAQSGYMPTLDLFAQRFQTDSSATARTSVPDEFRDPDLPPPPEFPADIDRTNDSVGLRLNWPIFSGGSTRASVREQVHLHRAERERLEGAMRAAERNTRDAYLGVLAEKARVRALQQSVKSSQTALEATEAGFEVGTRTTVDVLDGRRRLFEAQRNYARSRYDYLINVVRLKSAAGVLMADDITLINDLLNTPTPLPATRPGAGG